MDLSLHKLEASTDQDRDLVRLNVHSIFEDRVADVYRSHRIPIPPSPSRPALSVEPEPAAGIFTRDSHQAVDSEVKDAISKHLQALQLEPADDSLGHRIAVFGHIYDAVMRESQRTVNEAHKRKRLVLAASQIRPLSKPLDDTLGAVVAMCVDLINVALSHGEHATLASALGRLARSLQSMPALTLRPAVKPRSFPDIHPSINALVERLELMAMGGRVPRSVAAPALEIGMSVAIARGSLVDVLRRLDHAMSSKVNEISPQPVLKLLHLHDEITSHLQPHPSIFSLVWADARAQLIDVRAKHLSTAQFAGAIAVLLGSLARPFDPPSLSATTSGNAGPVAAGSDNDTDQVGHVETAFIFDFDESPGAVVESSPSPEALEDGGPCVREYLVRIPGARALALSFDEQCKKLPVGCFVSFYKSKTKSNFWGLERYENGGTGAPGHAPWPGVGDVPPLIIPGDTVYLSIHYPEAALPATESDAPETSSPPRAPEGKVRERKVRRNSAPTASVASTAPTQRPNESKRAHAQVADAKQAPPSAVSSSGTGYSVNISAYAAKMTAPKLVLDTPLQLEVQSDTLQHCSNILERAVAASADVKMTVEDRLRHAAIAHAMLRIMRNHFYQTLREDCHVDRLALPLNLVQKIRGQLEALAAAGGTDEATTARGSVSGREDGKMTVDAKSMDSKVAGVARDVARDSETDAKSAGKAENTSVSTGSDPSPAASGGTPAIASAPVSDLLDMAGLSEHKSRFRDAEITNLVPVFTTLREDPSYPEILAAKLGLPRAQVMTALRRVVQAAAAHKAKLCMETAPRELAKLASETMAHGLKIFYQDITSQVSLINATRARAARERLEAEAPGDAKNVKSRGLTKPIEAAGGALPMRIDRIESSIADEVLRGLRKFTTKVRWLNEMERRPTLRRSTRDLLMSLLREAARVDVDNVTKEKEWASEEKRHQQLEEKKAKERKEMQRLKERKLNTAPVNPGERVLVRTHGHAECYLDGRVLEVKLIGEARWELTVRAPKGSATTRQFEYPPQDNKEYLLVPTTEITPSAGARVYVSYGDPRVEGKWAWYGGRVTRWSPASDMVSGRAEVKFDDEEEGEFKYPSPNILQDITDTRIESYEFDELPIIVIPKQWQRLRDLEVKTAAASSAFALGNRAWTAEQDPFTVRSIRRISRVGSMLIQDRDIQAVSRFPTAIAEGPRLFTGKWYYEVVLTSSYIAQIGWAIRDEFRPPGENEGTGDDKVSWAYDGNRQVCFHGTKVTYKTGRWKAGDVVGCAVDLDKREMKFYLNGNSPGVAYRNFSIGTGLCPALTFSAQSSNPGSGRAIFSRHLLKHLPPGYKALLDISHSREFTRGTRRRTDDSEAAAHIELPNGILRQLIARARFWLDADYARRAEAEQEALGKSTSDDWSSGRSPLQRLVDLGYPEELCAQALSEEGGDVGRAADWLAVFTANDGKEGQDDEEEKVDGPVGRLMDLGYSRGVCEAALSAAEGDIERAGEWLLLHAERWMREHQEAQDAENQRRGAGGGAARKSAPNPFRNAQMDRVDGTRSAANAALYVDLFVDAAGDILGYCDEIFKALIRMAPAAIKNATRARWLLYTTRGSLIGSTAREIIVATWSVCRRIHSNPAVSLRLIPKLVGLIKRQRTLLSTIVTSVGNDEAHPLRELARWVYTRITLVNVRVVCLLCSHLSFSLPQSPLERSPAAASWVHCTLLSGGIASGVLPELKESLSGAEALVGLGAGGLNGAAGPGNDEGGTATAMLQFVNELRDEKGAGGRLIAAIRKTFRPLLLPRSVQQASAEICRLAFAAILKHTRMLRAARHVSARLEAADGNSQKLKNRVKLAFGILCEWWGRVRRIKQEMGVVKGSGGSLENFARECEHRMKLLLSLEPSPAVVSLPLFSSSEMSGSEGDDDDEDDDDEPGELNLSVDRDPMRLVRSSSSRWRRAQVAKGATGPALGGGQALRWAKKEIAHLQLMDSARAEAACTSMANVCSDILNISLAQPERFGTDEVRGVMLAQRSRALLRLKGLRFFSEVLGEFTRFPDAPEAVEGDGVGDRATRNTMRVPPVSAGERVLVRTTGYANHVCYIDGIARECVPIGTDGWQLHVTTPSGDRRLFAYPPGPSGEYLLIPREPLTPSAGVRVLAPFADEQTPDKWAWYAGKVREWRDGVAKVDFDDGTSWDIGFPSPHLARLAAGDLNLEFVQGLDPIEMPLVVVPLGSRWLAEERGASARGVGAAAGAQAGSKPEPQKPTSKGPVQRKTKGWTRCELISQAISHLTRVFSASSGGADGMATTSMASAAGGEAKTGTSTGARPDAAGLGAPSDGSGTGSSIRRLRMHPDHYLNNVGCAGPRLTSALTDAYFNIIQFLFRFDEELDPSSTHGTLIKQCAVDLCSVLSPCDLGHIQSLDIVPRLSKLATAGEEEAGILRACEADPSAMSVRVGGWLLFRLVSYTAFNSAAEYPKLCRTILDILHGRVIALERARRRVLRDEKRLVAIRDCSAVPKRVEEILAYAELSSFSAKMRNEGYDDAEFLLFLDEDNFEEMRTHVGLTHAQVLRLKRVVAALPKMKSPYGEGTLQKRQAEADARRERARRRAAAAGAAVSPEAAAEAKQRLIRKWRRQTRREVAIRTKFKIGQKVEYLSQSRQKWLLATVKEHHPDGTVTVGIAGTNHEKVGVLGSSVRMLSSKRGAAIAAAAPGPSGSPDGGRDEDDIKDESGDESDNDGDASTWSNLLLSDCCTAWYKHASQQGRGDIAMGAKVQVMGPANSWQDARVVALRAGEIKVQLAHGGAPKWVRSSPGAVRPAERGPPVGVQSAAAAAPPSKAVSPADEAQRKRDSELPAVVALSASEIELQLVQQLWVLLRAVKSKDIAEALATRRWLNLLVPIIIQPQAPHSSVSILAARVLRRALPCTRPGLIDFTREDRKARADAGVGAVVAASGGPSSAPRQSWRSLLQSMFEKIYGGIGRIADESFADNAALAWETVYLYRSLLAGSPDGRSTRWSMCAGRFLLSALEALDSKFPMSVESKRTQNLVSALAILGGEREPLRMGSLVSLATESEPGIIIRLSEHLMRPERAVASEERIKDLTIQSTHPYAARTSQWWDARLPGAKDVSVSFDPRSSTRASSDCVFFYKDRSRRQVFGSAHGYSGKNWPGVAGRPPLIIPTDSFVVYLRATSSSRENDWGFRFTASALEGRLPPDRQTAVLLDSGSVETFNAASGVRVLEDVPFPKPNARMLAELITRLSRFALTDTPPTASPPAPLARTLRLRLHRMCVRVLGRLLGTPGASAAFCHPGGAAVSADQKGSKTRLNPSECAVVPARRPPAPLRMPQQPNANFVAALCAQAMRPLRPIRGMQCSLENLEARLAAISRVTALEEMAHDGLGAAIGRELSENGEELLNRLLESGVNLTEGKTYEGEQIVSDTKQRLNRDFTLTALVQSARTQGTVIAECGASGSFRKGDKGFFVQNNVIKFGSLGSICNKGDRVMAKYRHGSQYEAQVVRINADGTITVNWEDGDGQANLSPSEVFKDGVACSGKGAVCGSTVVNDGKVHHVAVTYQSSSGGSVTLYVDGNVDASGTLRQSISLPDSVVKVGRGCDDFPKPQTHFTGSIHNPRFFPIVFSDAEMRVLAREELRAASKRQLSGQRKLPPYPDSVYLVADASDTVRSGPRSLWRSPDALAEILIMEYRGRSKLVCGPAAEGDGFGKRSGRFFAFLNPVAGASRIQVLRVTNPLDTDRPYYRFTADDQDGPSAGGRRGGSSSLSGGWRSIASESQVTAFYAFLRSVNGSIRFVVQSHTSRPRDWRIARAADAAASAAKEWSTRLEFWAFADAGLHRQCRVPDALGGAPAALDCAYARPSCLKASLKLDAYCALSVPIHNLIMRPGLPCGLTVSMWLRPEGNSGMTCRRLLSIIEGNETIYTLSVKSGIFRLETRGGGSPDTFEADAKARRFCVTVVAVPEKDVTVYVDGQLACRAEAPGLRLGPDSSDAASADIASASSAGESGDDEVRGVGDLLSRIQMSDLFPRFKKHKYTDLAAVAGMTRDRLEAMARRVGLDAEETAILARALQRVRKERQRLEGKREKTRFVLEGSSEAALSGRRTFVFVSGFEGVVSNIGMWRFALKPREARFAHEDLGYVAQDCDVTVAQSRELQDLTRDIGGAGQRSAFADEKNQPLALPDMMGSIQTLSEALATFSLSSLTKRFLDLGVRLADLEGLVRSARMRSVSDLLASCRLPHLERRFRVLGWDDLEFLIKLEPDELRQIVKDAEMNALQEAAFRAALETAPRYRVPEFTEIPVVASLDDIMYSLVPPHNLLKVTKLAPGSPAEHAGVRQGDLIVMVNGQFPSAAVLQSTDAKETALITLHRPVRPAIGLQRSRWAGISSRFLPRVESAYATRRALRRLRELEPLSPASFGPRGLDGAPRRLLVPASDEDDLMTDALVDMSDDDDDDDEDDDEDEPSNAVASDPIDVVGSIGRRHAMDEKALPSPDLSSLGPNSADAVNAEALTPPTQPPAEIHPAVASALRASHPALSSMVAHLRAHANRSRSAEAKAVKTLDQCKQTRRADEGADTTRFSSSVERIEGHVAAFLECLTFVLQSGDTYTVGRPTRDCGPKLSFALEKGEYINRVTGQRGGRLANGVTLHTSLGRERHFYGKRLSVAPPNSPAIGMPFAFAADAGNEVVGLKVTQYGGRAVVCGIRQRPLEIQRAGSRARKAKKSGIAVADDRGVRLVRKLWAPAAHPVSIARSLGQYTFQADLFFPKLSREHRLWLPDPSAPFSLNGVRALELGKRFESPPGLVEFDVLLDKTPSRPVVRQYHWDANTGMLGWRVLGGTNTFSYANGQYDNSTNGIMPSPYALRHTVHSPIVVRSPRFFNPTRIRFKIQGGIGVAVKPNETGFLGVALRRVSDNAYVKWFRRSENSKTFREVEWVLPASTSGEFTLELIDSYGCGDEWGHVGLNDVEIFSDAMPTGGPLLSGTHDGRLWFRWQLNKRGEPELLCFEADEEGGVASTMYVYAYPDVSLCTGEWEHLSILHHYGRSRQEGPPSRVTLSLNGERIADVTPKVVIASILPSDTGLSLVRNIGAVLRECRLDQYKPLFSNHETGEVARVLSLKGKAFVKAVVGLGVKPGHAARLLHAVASMRSPVRRRTLSSVCSARVGDRAIVRTTGFKGNTCYIEGRVAECFLSGGGWSLRIRAPVDAPDAMEFRYPPRDDEYILTPRSPLTPEPGMRVVAPFLDGDTAEGWAWFAGAVKAVDAKGVATVDFDDGELHKICYPSPRADRLDPSRTLDLKFVKEFADNPTEAPMVVLGRPCPVRAGDRVVVRAAQKAGKDADVYVDGRVRSTMDTGSGCWNLVVESPPDSGERRVLEYPPEGGASEYIVMPRDPPATPVIGARVIAPFLDPSAPKGWVWILGRVLATDKGVARVGFDHGPSLEIKVPSPHQSRLNAKLSGEDGVTERFVASFSEQPSLTPFIVVSRGADGAGGAKGVLGWAGASRTRSPHVVLCQKFRSEGISGHGYPLNTHYKNQEHQSIYLASELREGGILPGSVITGLSIKAFNPPGRDLENVRIACGWTSMSEFPIGHGRIANTQVLFGPDAMPCALFSGDLFHKDEKVKAKWQGGRTYSAVIKGVNRDGTYQVKYTDGDFDMSVKESDILLPNGEKKIATKSDQWVRFEFRTPLVCPDKPLNLVVEFTTQLGKSGGDGGVYCRDTGRQRAVFAFSDDRSDRPYGYPFEWRDHKYNRSSLVLDLKLNVTKKQRSRTIESELLGLGRAPSGRCDAPPAIPSCNGFVGTDLNCPCFSGALRNVRVFAVPPMVYEQRQKAATAGSSSLSTRGSMLLSLALDEPSTAGSVRDAADAKHAPVVRRYADSGERGIVHILPGGQVRVLGLLTPLKIPQRHWFRLAVRVDADTCRLVVSVGKTIWRPPPSTLLAAQFAALRLGREVMLNDGGAAGEQFFVHAAQLLNSFRDDLNPFQSLRINFFPEEKYMASLVGIGTGCSRLIARKVLLRNRYDIRMAANDLLINWHQLKIEERVRQVVKRSKHLSQMGLPERLCAEAGKSVLEDIDIELPLGRTWHRMLSAIFDTLPLLRSAPATPVRTRGVGPRGSTVLAELDVLAKDHFESQKANGMFGSPIRLPRSERALQSPLGAAGGTPRGGMSTTPLSARTPPVLRLRTAGERKERGVETDTLAELHKRFWVRMEAAADASRRPSSNAGTPQRRQRPPSLPKAPGSPALSARALSAARRGRGALSPGASDVAKLVGSAWDAGTAGDDDEAQRVVISPSELTDLVKEQVKIHNDQKRRLRGRHPAPGAPDSSVYGPATQTKPPKSVTQFLTVANLSKISRGDAFRIARARLVQTREATERALGVTYARESVVALLVGENKQNGPGFSPDPDWAVRFMRLVEYAHLPGAMVRLRTWATARVRADANALRLALQSEEAAARGAGAGAAGGGARLARLAIVAPFTCALVKEIIFQLLLMSERGRDRAPLTEDTVLEGSRASPGIAFWLLDIFVSLFKDAAEKQERLRAVLFLRPYVFCRPVMNLIMSCIVRGDPRYHLTILRVASSVVAGNAHPALGRIPPVLISPQYQRMLKQYMLELNDCIKPHFSDFFKSLLELNLSLQKLSASPGAASNSMHARARAAQAQARDAVGPAQQGGDADADSSDIEQAALAELTGVAAEAPRAVPSAPQSPSRPSAAATSSPRRVARERRKRRRDASQWFDEILQLVAFLDQVQPEALGRPCARIPVSFAHRVLPQFLDKVAANEDNAALGCRATQSSTDTPPTQIAPSMSGLPVFAAGRAVDGIVVSDRLLCSCTGTQDHPWWFVDLASPKDIEKIMIWPYLGSGEGPSAAQQAPAPSPGGDTKVAPRAPNPTTTPCVVLGFLEKPELGSGLRAARQNAVFAHAITPEDCADAKDGPITVTLVDLLRGLSEQRSTPSLDDIIKNAKCARGARALACDLAAAGCGSADAFVELSDPSFVRIIEAAQVTTQDAEKLYRELRRIQRVQCRYIAIQLASEGRLALTQVAVTCKAGEDSAPKRDDSKYALPPVAVGDRVLVKAKGYRKNTCYIESECTACKPISYGKWELSVRSPRSSKEEKRFLYPPVDGKYLLQPTRAVTPRVGIRVVAPFGDHNINPDRWAWYAGQVTSWGSGVARVDFDDGTTWNIRYPSIHQDKLDIRRHRLSRLFVQGLDPINLPLIVIPTDMRFPPSGQPVVASDDAELGVAIPPATINSLQIANGLFTNAGVRGVVDILNRWVAENGNKSPLGNAGAPGTLSQSAVQSCAGAQGLQSLLTRSHIRVQMTILRELNRMVVSAIPYIDLSLPVGFSLLTDAVRKVRSWILTHPKVILLDEALVRTQYGPSLAHYKSNGDAMKRYVGDAVSLDVLAAGNVTLKRQTDHKARRTMFGQLYQQLKLRSPDRVFCLGRNHRAFKVNYIGVNAIDAGGPYRDAIETVCRELQSPALPLFIRTPNGRMDAGTNRDAYVPRTSSKSLLHRALYAFLGRFFGLAIRTKFLLSLSFPSIIWKPLVGDAVTDADVKAMDKTAFTNAESIQALAGQLGGGVSAQDFDSQFKEITFKYCQCDGKVMSLRGEGGEAPGRDDAVTVDNYKLYITRLRKARLDEFSVHCAALRKGLGQVVPLDTLSLFTWKELELMVCGQGVTRAHMPSLRRMTSYSGCSPSDAHIKNFWKMMTDVFDDSQRAKFIAFTWGRSRLPHSEKDYEQRFKITSHNNAEASRNPDSFFPIAHTCFFQIELPRYTSIEAMSKKVIWAMESCASIDDDGYSSATGSRVQETEDDEAAESYWDEEY